MAMARESGHSQYAWGKCKYTLENEWMIVPENVIDIFLQPGEIYFGDSSTRIRTVLGSCVSLVLWHPEQVGGMCHFMLPNRTRARVDDTQDGRYADEAMALLLKDIDAYGKPRSEYQTKIFGGGDMFADSRTLSVTRVGMQNIQAARHLVEAHGFIITNEHVGSTGHRHLIFDIWSGKVWMKHVPKSISNASALNAGEKRRAIAETNEGVVAAVNYHHLPGNVEGLFGLLPR